MSKEPELKARDKVVLRMKREGAVPWTSDFTSNPLVGKLGVFRVQLYAHEMTPHL